MSTKDIDTFSPTDNQTFIMDTNVLIELLYPIMSTTQLTTSYMKLYEAIISKKAKLIITSIQISEFINRCIRLQFNLWKSTSGNSKSDFKSDYRETDDYRTSMQAILEIVQLDILSHATCIDDCFSEMNPENLYNYGFYYDFNDALISEVARINHAILITNDKDFANYSSGINILTANKSLLMFH